MIHIENPENCCGCHACKTSCPAQCITMAPDAEGFLYPHVDDETCLNCGTCLKVCPMFTTLPPTVRPKAYAAWHHDDTVRLSSSSGGIFSVLMEQIFYQKGIVFGAAFDNNNVLCHQAAQNSSDAVKFKGSKYLQSIISDSYKKAQTHLKQGRTVLFSGTPCQIAGLYTFLGKDDKNLLTVDVVCHGVPSPKVFATYRKMMEKRYGAGTKQITFRDKRHGWRRFSLSLSFKNGRHYSGLLDKDPFMIGFLKDLYLRPSCHTCQFSRLPRVADISLGDFWGIEKHSPEWDDDKGVSLVLLQTAKGKKFFDTCQKVITAHRTDLNIAIQSNPCIVGPVVQKNKRKDFFNDFSHQPFKNIIKKYMRPKPVWRKAIGRIKNTTAHVLGK